MREKKSRLRERRVLQRVRNVSTFLSRKQKLKNAAAKWLSKALADGGQRPKEWSNVSGGRRRRKLRFKAIEQCFDLMLGVPNKKPLKQKDEVARRDIDVAFSPMVRASDVAKHNHISEPEVPLAKCLVSLSVLTRQIQLAQDSCPN